MAKLHSEQDPYFTPDRLDYQYIAAEDLAKQGEEKFDVVCAMEVIEHVDKPAEFLKTCSKLVKVSLMISVYQNSNNKNSLVDIYSYQQFHVHHLQSY